MVNLNPIVAVLSGDLIGSSDAGPTKTNAAIGHLWTTFATMGDWDVSRPTHFTRMRGDGWQFLLTDRKYALRSSLRIFASMRSEKGLLQTRISIGIGPIYPVAGPDLSAASGPAFEASGHTLDAMTKSNRFAISGNGVTPLHNAVVALVEEQIKHWTAEQAQAAAYYLDPRIHTLKDIAKKLGISTQAVHSRIKGAGAQTLRRVVQDWEKYTEETTQ